MGALGRLLHLDEAIRESLSTCTSLPDILSTTTQQSPSAKLYNLNQVISLFGKSKSLLKPRNNLAAVGSTIGLEKYNEKQKFSR